MLFILIFCISKTVYDIQTIEILSELVRIAPNNDLVVDNNILK